MKEREERKEKKKEEKKSLGWIDRKKIKERRGKKRARIWIR